MEKKTSEKVQIESATRTTRVNMIVKMFFKHFSLEIVFYFYFHVKIHTEFKMKKHRKISKLVINLK